MIAPLSWLKEYVDIDCTPQELQEKLFSCGFEVEELNEEPFRIPTFTSARSTAVSTAHSRSAAAPITLRQARSSLQRWSAQLYTAQTVSAPPSRAL